MSLFDDVTATRQTSHSEMDPWVERDGVFELDLRNLLGGLLGSFIPDPEALA